MPKFTKINKLSDERRHPRLGKIHLGMKDKGRGFPIKTDYFVFDDSAASKEAMEIYGDKPKSLDILLPSLDQSEIFPQAYKSYQRIGNCVLLACTGDGKQASKLMPDGSKQKISCKDESECELYNSGKCKRMGNLFVILPMVSFTGVFQIDTSSVNSIIDINSGIEKVKEFSKMLGVHPMQIPAKLILKPTQTQYENKDGQIQKGLAYTMQLIITRQGLLDVMPKMREAWALIPTNEQLALPEPTIETDLIPSDLYDPEYIEPETDIEDEENGIGTLIEAYPENALQEIIEGVDGKPCPWDCMVDMAHTKLMYTRESLERFCQKEEVLGYKPDWSQVTKRDMVKIYRALSAVVVDAI